MAFPLKVIVIDFQVGLIVFPYAGKWCLIFELELRLALSFWRIEIFSGILYYGLIIVEKVKKEALRTATRVSEQLMKAVDGGVHEIFINEKRIKVETRALESTIMRFLKQTNQWLAASHAINTAVKVSIIVFLLHQFCRIMLCTH